MGNNVCCASSYNCTGDNGAVPISPGSNLKVRGKGIPRSSLEKDTCEVLEEGYSSKEESDALASG